MTFTAAHRAYPAKPMIVSLCLSLCACAQPALLATMVATASVVTDPSRAGYWRADERAPGRLDHDLNECMSQAKAAYPVPDAQAFSAGHWEDQPETCTMEPGPPAQVCSNDPVNGVPTCRVEPGAMQQVCRSQPQQWVADPAPADPRAWPRREVLLKCMQLRGHQPA